MIEEKKYSILIVDDEPANVRLLSYMLRDQYPVREAYGGAEALQIANGDDQPALILLDVVMPDIDGFEVCRRLKTRNETKNIVVIFVTTLSESSAEEIGLNLGAADYIVKPLSMPVVRARVRHHMNLRRQADMLEALSYIDGLTHVHNRRRFDAALQTEWQRGLRRSRSLAVIMIDFDHFKALNDYYGHGTGDTCLQKGAAALAETLKRPADLLARYGGEEFVALLPETELADACRIAEAMRQAINALNLKHEHSTVADHVTISLGVAAMQPNAHDQARDLLELADRALNQAKSKGRNRVQMARSDSNPTSADPPPAEQPATPPVPSTALTANCPTQGACPSAGAAESSAARAGDSASAGTVQRLADRQRTAQGRVDALLTTLEELLQTSLDASQYQLVLELLDGIRNLWNGFDGLPAVEKERLDALFADLPEAASKTEIQ